MSAAQGEQTTSGIRPSRRTVVVATVVAAGGALTGCGRQGTSPVAARRTTPSPTRATRTADLDDVSLVKRVWRDTLELHATLVDPHASRGRTRNIRAEFRLTSNLAGRQAQALQEALADPPRRVRPRVQRLSRTDADAVAEVVDLLTTAAAERTDDCLRAGSGAVAALMASLAASHRASAARWKELA